MAIPAALAAEGTTVDSVPDSEGDSHVHFDRFA
jgi:hypothetical protein